MEITVKVLGGLEVTLAVQVDGPDYSVGINSPYLTGWQITEIAGRPLRRNEKTTWIEKRLTKWDEETIYEAAMKAYNEAESDARCIRRHGYEAWSQI